MRRNYGLAIVCIASLLFLRCQRELRSMGSGDQGQILMAAPIVSNVHGNVFDENGQPAEGVTVRVGAKFATTDNKGYFRINSAALDKNQALVTAEKDGYFRAFRCFSATTGANQVIIKMIKKTLGGTVNGSSGGTVTLPNGAKVALPAGGIVKAADNSSYGGNVNVFAAYINTGATDILQTVPGSFMANDKDGKRVMLSSYGMIAVELESPAGEKLQIKSGSAATLTLPIPTTIQGAAPSSIPLWFIDEGTGLWKEEGTAIKQGNYYVGSVSHFSYWNCDFPYQTVNFTATFINADAQLLIHALVMIIPAIANVTGSAYGYTDSLGQISGAIPSNSHLILKVLNPCGSAVYSQNIGPFAQNVNLGTISMPISNASIVTVKGKLLNCAGTSVTNGYAIISIGNNVHYAAVNTSGEYSTNFVTCSGQPSVAQIFGVDALALQQGPVSLVPLTLPSTNAGEILACGLSAQQYINYTCDGVSYSIVAPADSLSAFTQPAPGASSLTTTIDGSQNSNSTYLGFRFNSASAATGTYPILWLQSSAPGIPQNAGLSNPGINVIITAFPTAAGQFYEGSFSGSFIDSQSINHSINCNFRVRRSF